MRRKILPKRQELTFAWRKLHVRAS